MATERADLDSGLRECVRAQMTRWTVPGAAVGILHDGTMTTYGFGITSLETDIPVPADCLFRVGSITKPFTATLAMIAAEAGLLDLDAPVIVYFPELRLADADAQATITMRHLLTHQSGLACELPADLFRYGTSDDALPQMIADYALLRQWTPPGALWSYCNSGYWLAGAVLARIFGETFEDALREHIFAPLSMTRSCFFADEAIFYPAALGHNLVSLTSDTHRLVRPYRFPRSRVPSGGIVSTVGELLRFAQFHLTGETASDGPIIADTARQAMRQPQIDIDASAAQGLGWRLDQIGGRAVFGHGGSAGGFESGLTIVPDRRFALVVLTNSGRGSVAIQRIRDWALDAYCGLPVALPEPITLPDAALARFVGRYVRPDTHLTLTARDGGLAAKVVVYPGATNEDAPAPIFYQPISDTEFIAFADDAARGNRIRFFGDAAAPRFVRFGGRLTERSN